MVVSKWGNSLAIRIPVDVARELGLKEGDDVNVCALDGDRVAVISERQRRASAVDTLRQLRGSLPLDYKFDRDDANAR